MKKNIDYNATIKQILNSAKDIMMAEMDAEPKKSDKISILNEVNKLDEIIGTLPFSVHYHYRLKNNMVLNGAGLVTKYGNHRYVFVKQFLHFLSEKYYTDKSNNRFDAIGKSKLLEFAKRWEIMNSNSFKQMYLEFKSLNSFGVKIK